jgi:GntR family transcriptional repressor for pyruvate dehydrogenase complex
MVRRSDQRLKLEELYIIDINPINTKRIYQSVIEQFIGLIKSGELKIGDLLPPERVLAEQFKVSRQSLREAFRVMEVIGIIEVRSAGTFVTQVNVGNIMTTIAPLFMLTSNTEQDLLEFRRLLETEAVRLAAAKQIQPAITRLQEAVALMRQSMLQDNPKTGVEADVLFHKAIFQCSDNYVLMQAAECVSYLLENSVRMNRARILKNTARAEILLEQHQHILETIQQGDAALAFMAMADHLQYVKQSLAEPD